MNIRIAVVGLGYVGLPIALALSRKYPEVLGFDINQKRVADLTSGLDSNGETEDEEFNGTSITFSANPKDLTGFNFYIIAVPTPIDHYRRPDLSALEAASRTIAPYLKKGDIIVYESTVYPGVTEDFCGKILEEVSGLKSGIDFKLGYSPERINPGDKVNTLETIVKVVSAQDNESLEQVAKVYEGVVTAGVHRASSIKVAEAAKVIENTQRDLNIALMNELAIIFDMMNIPTNEVLEAAGTKWNFLKFFPGLVGGHCIGVDPYYLTTAAEAQGYHPEVILAGRRINDNMGKWIAKRTIKIMIQADIAIRAARVGILGITFKENVPDTRNSRVPDIYRELIDFGCIPALADPMASVQECREEYGIDLCDLETFSEFDVLIIAVGHDCFKENYRNQIDSMLKAGGVMIDIKGIFPEKQAEMGHRYWRL